MRRTAAALLLGVMTAVAACGNAEPGAPGQPAGPGTSPVQQDEGEQVTISGMIERGVEAGCFVLEHEGTQYLLLSETAEFTPGAQVEITGTTQPDAMTICQQGLPLRVDEVSERP